MNRTTILVSFNTSLSVVEDREGLKNTINKLDLMDMYLEHWTNNIYIFKQVENAYEFAIRKIHFIQTLFSKLNSVS